MNELVLNKICRIAGEAMLVFYEKDGKVEDCLFVSTAPIRGFEKMVVGKNPLFAVESVMRICGLCHASHGIAASEAIEHAIGIIPPRNGLLIREALGLINRIQSHTMLFLMVAADLIKESKRNEVLFKLMEFYTGISNYLLKLGGAATHPPNLTVGGMLSVPKGNVLDSLISNFPRLLEQWRYIEEILTDETIQTEIADELREAKVENEYLASSVFYGDRFNVIPEKVAFIPYYKYREENQNSKGATTFVSFYNGRAVEVGPRARMKVFRRFEDNSLYSLHLARVVDTRISLSRLKEVLDGININEPFRTKSIIFAPGKGVGVYEAPRGTLLHFVELGEEGRILSLKIVVPTMFNIPVMENAAKGLSIRAAEAVIRLYDPCIPCTTHVIKLR